MDVIVDTPTVTPGGYRIMITKPMISVMLLQLL